MNKKIKNLLLKNTIYVCIFFFTPIRAITVEELLKKMDLNKDWKTLSAKATLEIIVDKEKRIKKMETLSDLKSKKSFVIFTNPEDKGTKFLMIGKELWIYFPEENDIVKISGHLLKEGIMGSDVSYEDALEADILSNKYNATITSEENLDGSDCYVITLIAKVKDVPYYKRVMWVDKKRYISLKEDLFSKSDKLLKTANTLSVKEIEGRYYPVKVEMINRIRNSRTIFTLDSLSLNAPLDESIFTLRNLRK